MKIRKIYNFLGNKILNVKVNTPTETEHITNKEYVDKNDTYDTLLSQTTTSTKFNWLNNINNLKIKEVLDKLLFPVINPDYINPEFITNIFTINNNAFLEDEIVTGKLIYDIENIDRNLLNTNTILTITDTNNVITTFNSIDNLLTGFINFELKISSIQEIKITKEFGIAIIKNDSDGNPFVDNNFNSNYILTKIFTKDQFINELNIFKILPSIYHINNFDVNNTQFFLDKNISEFTNSSNLTLPVFDELEPLKNVYLFLIHPSLLNEQFYLKSFNLQDKMIGMSMMVDFEYHLLFKSIDDTKYVKTINNIDYYAIMIDFGKNTSIRKTTVKIV